jgi:ribosome modulation factor
VIFIEEAMIKGARDCRQNVARGNCPFKEPSKRRAWERGWDLSARNGSQKTGSAMSKNRSAEGVLEVQIAALAQRLVDLEKQNSALQETNSRLYMRAQTVEALLAGRPGSLVREQVKELAIAADYYDDGKRKMDLKISIMVSLGELVAVRDFVGRSKA